MLYMFLALGVYGSVTGVSEGRQPRKYHGPRLHRMARSTTTTRTATTRHGDAEGFVVRMSPSCTALSSLTPAEIIYATAAVKAHIPRAILTFYEVQLREHFTSAQKAAALAGDESILPPRRASILASEPRRRRVLVGHAPVDPSGAPPVLQSLHDVQPALTAEEYALCERLTRECARRCAGSNPRLLECCETSPRALWTPRR